MALISCPECGHKVSSKAAACPKCAHPLARGGARAQKVEVTSGLLGQSGTMAHAANVGCLAVLLLVVLFLIRAFS